MGHIVHCEFLFTVHDGHEWELKAFKCTKRWMEVGITQSDGKRPPNKKIKLTFLQMSSTTWNPASVRVRVLKKIVIQHGIFGLPTNQSKNPNPSATNN